MENVKKKEKEIVIKCIDCGGERTIKERYSKIIVRCVNCQAEKIRSTRLAYSAEKLTMNEINVISKYDYEKLIKYYKAALRRDEWGIIDKKKVFSYCKAILDRGNVEC
jgi:uncharacterized Zn finger protein